MVQRFTARYLPVLLTLTFPLSAAPAQQSVPDAPTPQRETVIRSTVRLVEVSLVVEDKKGMLRGAQHSWGTRCGKKIQPN